MVKRLFFILSAVAVATFSAQCADSDIVYIDVSLKGRPITHEMLKEAQETNNRIQERKEGDLLALAKEGKFDEASEKSKRVAIGQLQCELRAKLDKF